MFFKQIKQRGDNFSYVIADEVTREAAVVDPSFNFEAIVRLLKDRNLNAKYIINTHHHMDHTAGNEDVRSVFGSKVVAHKLAKVRKDVAVVDANVCRILGRAFGLEVKGEPRRDPKFREIAQNTLPEGKAKEFNWAMIDLGALVCTPRKPSCGLCLMLPICDYGQEHRVRKP